MGSSTSLPQVTKRLQLKSAKQDPSKLVALARTFQQLIHNQIYLCYTPLEYCIQVVVSGLVCPPLETPNKAQLARVCPRQATVGVSCTFSCVPGTAQSDGSLKRTCLYDLSWSGTPLVCTSTFRKSVSASGECLCLSHTPTPEFIQVSACVRVCVRACVCV